MLFGVLNILNIFVSMSIYGSQLFIFNSPSGGRLSVSKTTGKNPLSLKP